MSVSFGDDLNHDGYNWHDENDDGKAELPAEQRDASEQAAENSGSAPLASNAPCTPDAPEQAAEKSGSAPLASNAPCTPDAPEQAAEKSGCTPLAPNAPCTPDAPEQAAEKSGSAPLAQNAPCEPDAPEQAAEKSGVEKASILERIPPTSEDGAAQQEGTIGVYGISRRGTSHVAKNQPCQDYNAFRYLQKEKIWILGIADGVGSCSLSHWGAYTAVNAAIEYLSEQLAVRSAGDSRLLTLQDYPAAEIESMLNESFDEARAKVEDFADAHQRPVYDLQSTLTVALYDGATLYCCHVGDDGIVAEGVSGKYLMVTERVKGDTANSVYPLQSGRWSVRRVNNVVAFVMSTDGILDSYVGNDAANRRVYYPFFQQLTYGMQVKQGQQPREAVDAACREAVKLLRQKAKAGVSDDLTVLAVANQALLERPTRPSFSQEEWDRETEAIERERRKQIYSPVTLPQKPAVVSNYGPAAGSSKPAGGRKPAAVSNYGSAAGSGKSAGSRKPAAVSNYGPAAGSGKPAGSRRPASSYGALPKTEYPPDNAPELRPMPRTECADGKSNQASGLVARTVSSILNGALGGGIAIVVQDEECRREYWCCDTCRYVCWHWNDDGTENRATCPFCDKRMRLRIDH